MATTEKNLVEQVMEIDTLLARLNELYGDDPAEELLQLARFIGAKELQRAVAFFENC